MGESSQKLTITLVGAGNLATNLGLALRGAGHNIICVYSRTETSAKTLAEQIGCAWTTEVAEAAQFSDRSDVAVISVKDSALADLTKAFVDNPHTLFLHTAGSVPMDVLPTKHRGVLYPMQTFSKERLADFSKIPTFCEVSDERDRAVLERLVLSITPCIHWLDSQSRKNLHLAAVFACNFTNYCCDVSAQLLGQIGLSFDVMLPLIEETTAKLQQLSPFAAQTGPAVRYDRNVIDRHLAMLADKPDFQQLYATISEQIHRRHTPPLPSPQGEGA